MAKTIKTTFKLRRGTATEWLAANPILNQGEPGFEIDTNKLKIGNGMDRWNKLEYIAGEASEDASGGGAAEIYIGTTAPTGKYKLWINPEGEISEGGMGGTGDYGKEIINEAVELLHLYPQEDGTYEWDDKDKEEEISYSSGKDSEEMIEFNLCPESDDSPHFYDFRMNSQIQPMYEGLNFYITINEQTETYKVKTTKYNYDGEIIDMLYVGSEAMAEAMMNKDYETFMTVQETFIMQRQYDEEYSLQGFFKYNDSLSSITDFKIAYDEKSYVKLPGTALTAGAGINIDEKGKINVTYGQVKGQGAVDTFTAYDIGYNSTPITVSAMSNPMCFYHYRDSSFCAISSPFNMTSSSYNSNYFMSSNNQPNYYKDSERNNDKTNSPDYGNYIIIDYKNDSGLKTVICNRIYNDTSNLQNVFNNFYEFNNPQFYIGRYNTNTEYNDMFNGIVPFNNELEAFFLVFVYESAQTDTSVAGRGMAFIVASSDISGKDKKFWDGDIIPIYSTLPLEAISSSDKQNLTKEKDKAFIRGYHNIYNKYSCGIIFGDYNNISNGDASTLIFGNNNTGYGNVTTIFGNYNAFPYCDNLFIAGNNNTATDQTVAMIGRNLNGTNGSYHTILGYSNLSSGQYNIFSQYLDLTSDVFQIGHGDYDLSYNVFGVNPNLCYRQSREYNESTYSYEAKTYRLWDDSMKLDYIDPSAATTETLIQALINAGFMKGANE